MPTSKKEVRDTSSASTDLDMNNKKVKQILSAAWQVFCEHGYDTSSTDLIAKTAGVSKATLYAHFPSKKAVLMAVVEQELRSLSPKPLWEPEPGPVDVPATLRRIGKSQLNFLLHPHNMAMRHLMEMQSHRFPEIGKMFWQGGPGKARIEVAAFLRVAVAEGQLEITDIDLAATQFLSLVRGDFPMQRMMVRERPAEEKLAAQIEGAIRVFLAAYQRPPAGNA